MSSPAFAARARVGAGRGTTTVGRARVGVPALVEPADHVPQDVFERGEPGSEPRGNAACLPSPDAPTRPHRRLSYPFLGRPDDVGLGVAGHARGRPAGADRWWLGVRRLGTARTAALDGPKRHTTGPGGPTIADAACGEALGSVSRHRVHRGPKPESSKPMIGFRLKRTARGDGVGAIAQRLLVDNLFAETKTNRAGHSPMRRISPNSVQSNVPDSPARE